MKVKEKTEELVNRFMFAGIYFTDGIDGAKKNAKQCALIALENEYKSLREMLFNLKACRVIADMPYLIRIQKLIDEEKEVKQEIENL